jgi:LysR family glycine cleavage system transcriptional activator
MRSWIPSLNALRAFEVTARLGSYRLAAEELGVTTAAVKQLVLKLEESMGTQLVQGRGTGLELSSIGLDAAEELEMAFRQIERTVHRMRSRIRKRSLVISSDPSFATAWLVPRLKLFKSISPGTEVLLDSSPRIVDLDAGVADIAIRFGVTDHGNAVSYRLFDEYLAAYCSPSLAAGPPDIRSIRDLAHAPLLRWDLSDYEWAKTTRSWNQWRHWLAELGLHDIDPSDGPRFSDYNLALQAAIAGQGFILGSRPVLSDIVEAGLLIDPFDRSVDTRIGYDIVTTKAAMAIPAVSAFVDWIRAEAASASKEGPASGVTPPEPAPLSHLTRP